MTDRPLMRPSEVAAIFDVTEQTIYNWRRQGVLKGVLIGGSIRFRRADVDALVAGGAPTDGQAV